jgi:2-polyprenyl-3-methyl-5-hydroxy-6-metoxy-1,4-benzoquinol methylase
MLDSEGVKAYWEEQTRKGDNPCHYHNVWQDRYAFEMRSGALRTIDFTGAREIVDVGCGIGEYSSLLASLTSAHIHGFDFPFNVEIAKKRFGDISNVTFLEGSVPDEVIREKIANADMVVTTTVFVHFSPEARDAFFSYIQENGKGWKGGTPRVHAK